MPKLVQKYSNNKGDTFDTLEEATISDIAAAFDNNIGVARQIWDKRLYLMEVFAEYDTLGAQREQILETRAERAAGGIHG